MSAIHGRQRLRARLVAVTMLVIFGILGVRVGLLFMSAPKPEPQGNISIAKRRSDIIDRNGALLATSISAWSLFADPRAIWDAGDIVLELQKIFPDLDADRLQSRLADRQRAFVWIRRHLTPRQKQAVFDLGIEGIGFVEEKQRVYPGGALAGHVLGSVDIDGHGRSGLELAYDQKLRSGGEALRLTIDLAVQQALEYELQNTATRYAAAGAAGLVIESNSGALRAIASWPPIDPHRPAIASMNARLNRASGAVFELGSIFKPLTIAAALEARLVEPDEIIDVARPVDIGSVQITDNHRSADEWRVWEIIAHSSNVGTVRIAERIGVEALREFFSKAGLLSRPKLDFPGVAHPLTPENWDRLAMATASYGHGIAVSPLSLAMAYAAIANAGMAMPPLLVETGHIAKDSGTQIISKDTAAKTIEILRAVVTNGTGKNADIPGYWIAGKTGTAEKPGRQGYHSDRNICSFAGIFPSYAPKYVVMIVLDEPGEQSAAFNAAPAVGRLVLAIAPVLGVSPVFATSPKMQGDRL